MKICLILTDIDQARQSHKIALDLEERFNDLSDTSVDFVDLVDFQFPDLHLTNLESLVQNADKLVLVGTANKPIYPYTIHYLLDAFGAQLVGKTVRTVLIGNMAEAAGNHLNRTLSQLGIKNGLPFSLIEVSPFFDQYLNLVNEPLAYQLDLFVKDCAQPFTSQDNWEEALQLNE